jgi:hypothetical protein
MVAFDGYTGPPFHTDEGAELLDRQGNLVVPILQVRQDFNLKNKFCSRFQFPLVVAYAITVHKSQGVTLPRVVCDISEKDFTTGLSYVAISRVSTLNGLMFDAPFDRSCVFRAKATNAMQARLTDVEERKKSMLTEPLYRPENAPDGSSGFSDDDHESYNIYDVSSDEDGGNG